MAKRIKYEMKVKVNIDDQLLGETIWLGTEKQLDFGYLSEGLVTKHHPVIMVKLDGQEESMQVKLEDLWIKNPDGRLNRPLR